MFLLCAYFACNLIYCQTAADYANQAAQAFDKNDFKGAIKLYTKSIKLDKSNPDIYDKRGLTYYYINQYDSAKSDFKIAIDLRPDFKEAFQNRAVVESDINDYD